VVPRPSPCSNMETDGRAEGAADVVGQYGCQVTESTYPTLLLPSDSSVRYHADGFERSSILGAHSRCIRRLQYYQANTKASMEGRLGRRCVRYRIDGETRYLYNQTGVVASCCWSTSE
jgi:hypothetical protein